MTAMRVLLCSLLLCTSVVSAARTHRGLRGRSVEDPCDPDDENYDPTDPACEAYDEDEEGPKEDADEGDDNEDGGEEGPPGDGDDGEGGPPGGGKGKGKGKGKGGGHGDGHGGEGDEEGGPPGEGGKEDWYEEGGPPGEGGKEDWYEEGGPPGEGEDCRDWCPKCDEPEFPDYDPQDEECYGKKEEEEIMGDGEDNMAEEMTDVHDGPHFEDIDTNGDDSIDINEAHTYGVANGLSMDDTDDIFDYMDMNKDKVVSREEFESGPSQDATEDMAPTHSDLDLNGDGEIEWLEWEAGCVCGKSYLSTCGDEEFCKDIFHAADEDGDELVTKDEFNGAGEECKTADDGNCDLLALKKSAQVKKLKKFSMAAWVRKHFKHSGHNLFALAKLRHQHKKGIFTKLTVLISRKHAQKINAQKINEQALKINEHAKKINEQYRQAMVSKLRNQHKKARRHVPRRARAM